MTVNGINGVNMPENQMEMNQAADSYSRNIQNQIANAQKQLQELSSNADMTMEEKMKKRQELQQQISDLNMQLRQHQMELRREKQQAKESETDAMSGGAGNAKTDGAGFSQAGMAAMLSADSSMKQARVQGGVATQMEGKAGVLESEIRLDSMKGKNVEKKKEELADVTQKAQAATASQFSALAEAEKSMEKASQADNEAQGAEKESTEKAVAGEYADNERKAVGRENAEGAGEAAAGKDAGKEEPAAAVREHAQHVDIRL